MKKLLIVVDMQNDFIDGALGFAWAKDIYPYVLEQIKEYEKNDDEVIFTRDSHDENYLSSMEGKYLPVEHVIKGTDGWLFYGELEEISKKHHVFEKPTFGSVLLGEYLLKNKFETITLLGIVSNMCVISNAIVAKTAQPETRIIVDSKGSASFDLEMEAKAYAILENLHIDVI